MQGCGTLSSIHCRFGAAEHLKIFCQGGLLLKTIIKEVTGKDAKTSIFSDNKSLVEAAHTTTQMENKRLQIDMGILREMLERGELDELRWIDTKHQVANPLTKAGAPADYLLSIITGQLLKFNFNTGIFA